MDDAVPAPTPGPVPGPPPGRRSDAATDLGSDEAMAAGLDALLAPLQWLEDRPVGEHPAAFEQVHARLRAVLAGEPVTGDAAPRA